MYPNLSIDSKVERLETEAVTCTQLSSCSQAYEDLNGWVSSVSFVRSVRVLDHQPLLKFASYSDNILEGMNECLVLLLFISIDVLFRSLYILQTAA